MKRMVLAIILVAAFFSSMFELESSALDVGKSSAISASLPCAEHAPGSGDQHDSSPCLYSHCHSGHCAVIGGSFVGIFLFEKIEKLGYAVNLYPSDFIAELLRPPIS